MKKSILALLLAVLMVASLLPAAAMADEGNEAKIGDTEYPTLAAAVEAVADNTPTTITLLRDVTNGAGIEVKSNKQITFDFAGHTYTVTHDPVGSSGTETQCFQLLRDSTVIMKDGSIVANNLQLQMIIQKYCNLTLNNMTLDATVGDNNIGYVLSNNCGNTVITGNTNITAKAGDRAFDVYYWPNGGYGDGLSVTVDENMTGTITGIIEYSNDGTDTGYADNAKLNIKGGNFVGTFREVLKCTGVSELPDASINVSGGSFNNPVAPKYLDESLKYQVKNDSTYTYYETFDEALAAAENGAEISGVNDASTETYYTIIIDPANGGAVTTYTVPSGSEIPLYTPNKSGYAFLGWSGSDGNTYAGTDTVTVTSDIKLTGSWVRHPDTPYVPEPEEPEEPEVPEFPFYDVPTSAWYYTAVKYVYDNKLMDGVDTYVFAPNDTLTRAMVWTIIARMSGVDTTGGNSWYAKAQEWVITNGISDGENPTAAITREEFVTMLWRLAGEPIYTGDLSRVPDAGSISTWAQNAMLWSYATGLTEGDENGALTPLATATRAQAAAMIMRFCESVK